MCCVYAKEEAPDLSLYSRSALLLDASNNRVLYEENGYQVMAMASTTKIMTCILAIESGRLEETVEVSANAQKMPKVHLGMRAGETYQLKDLLYSLMLESHNDTAVAIAEHLGGSVEGFADMMNAKAAELGCKDTCFITPNGLDARKDGKTHSTTARDLAVIAAYAIQNPEFLKIIGTRSYAFSELSGKRSFQISNKNAFLDMMEGAIGVKTGFTCEAGYCFVGALQRDGKTFVSVVLGAGWPPNKTWKWHDTKILMNFGLENYSIKNIYKKTTYKKMEVLNGVEEQIEIGAEQRDISLLLSDYDQVEMKQTFPKTLEAPVAEGTVIGYETYYVNGEKLTEIPILTKESTEAYTWKYCLDKVLHLFFANTSQKLW
ncbi:MAG: D-alanyl-D-alanine carboxypeptidase [Lachnospiraceae bacterium]|nr:D-alanyl-D-alanine carboxypeptidase [Lachnospiraceae bacterium]